MMSMMEYKNRRTQDDLTVVILAGNAAILSGVSAVENGGLAWAAMACGSVLALNSALRLIGAIDKIDLTK